MKLQQSTTFLFNLNIKKKLYTIFKEQLKNMHSFKRLLNYGSPYLTNVYTLVLEFIIY